jgi:hypothetical protein
MGADLRDPQMKTVTALVTGVLGDLQLLVEQQFQLTRCEIEQELRQRAKACAILGTGIAGLFLSAILLSLSAAHGLHWAASPTNSDPASLPLWGCEILVAIVVAGIAAFSVRVGLRRLSVITNSQRDALSRS